MNPFMFLDDHFPTGAARHSGEVVGITVLLCDLSWGSDNSDPVRISWKEKAWYRNASVNAFHMHRGLCRELGQTAWFMAKSRVEQRSLKATLAGCISEAYAENFLSNGECQYSTFTINRVGRYMRHVFVETQTGKKYRILAQSL